MNSNDKYIDIRQLPGVTGATVRRDAITIFSDAEISVFAFGSGTFAH